MDAHSDEFYKEYIDDGLSGINDIERPQFMEMIEILKRALYFVPFNCHCEVVTAHKPLSDFYYKLFFHENYYALEFIYTQEQKS